MMQRIEYKYRSICLLASSKLELSSKQKLEMGNPFGPLQSIVTTLVVWLDLVIRVVELTIYAN